MEVKCIRKVHFLFYYYAVIFLHIDTCLHLTLSYVLLLFTNFVSKELFNAKAVHKYIIETLKPKIR